MNVELVSNRDCPNVSQARANLLRAFAETGLPARWREWDCSADETPVHARHWGSPTILVNGDDVAGGQPLEGLVACRLYRMAGNPAAMPPVEVIVDALLKAEGRNAVQTGRPVPASACNKRRVNWRQSWLMLPGIAVGLLPKLACPACWPAYAALVSTLGFSFLLSDRHFFALTVAFLGMTVGALSIGITRRREYGPFFLGLSAGALILIGKFAVASDAMLYTGIALLAAVSIWKVVNLRRPAGGHCPACGGGDEAAKEKITGR